MERENYRGENFSGRLKKWDKKDLYGNLVS